MTHFRLYKLFALLACCFLLACTALKQDLEPQSTDNIDSDLLIMPKSKPDLAAATPSGIKPMTLEELTKCATKKQDLKNSILQYEQAKTQLAKRKAELVQNKKTLESQRKIVNAKNAKQLSDLNQRLYQQSSAINEFNADISTFNRKVSEQNIKNDNFNIACGDRSYQKSDLSKLAPDLRLAIEGNTEQSNTSMLKDTMRIEAVTESPGNSQ